MSDPEAIEPPEDAEFLEALTWRVTTCARCDHQRVRTAEVGHVEQMSAPGARTSRTSRRTRRGRERPQTPARRRAVPRCAAPGGSHQHDSEENTMGLMGTDGRTPDDDAGDARQEQHPVQPYTHVPPPDDEDGAGEGS